MKLRADLDEGWAPRATPDGTLYTSPGGELSVLVTHLLGAHADPPSLLRRSLTHDLSGPAEQPTRTAAAQTDDGWPVTLLELTGHPGRLAAYLHLLDYGGAIVARCRDVVARPGWRDEVLAIVACTRPDFTQEDSVCLAHQLEGIAGT